MVGPARRRQAVEHLQECFDASERRACRTVDQPRSTQRYQPQVKNDEPALITRMHEQVRQHPRYGYRRVWALLRAEGFRVNRKRIHRLWRQEGFKVPAKQHKRRRWAPAGRGRSQRCFEAMPPGLRRTLILP